MGSLMYADTVITFNLGQWGAWVPAVVGGVLTGVVLLVGIVVFPRRRSRPSQPEPQPQAPQPAAERDPFLFGSARDRRQAFRRMGNPVPVLVSDAAGNAPPFSAHVVDRSTGGLCLAVHEAIPEGTILSVRAAKAVGVLPWAQVEVRSCRETSGGWQLGCRFVRTPASTVLWSFG